MTNGIPREIRRWICSGERFIADWLTGRRSRLVRPNWPRSGSIFPVQLTLNQPIPETEYVQAKRCNLELARRLVDNLPPALRDFFLLAGDRQAHPTAWF